MDREFYDKLSEEFLNLMNNTNTNTVYNVKIEKGARTRDLKLTVYMNEPNSADMDFKEDINYIGEF